MGILTECQTRICRFPNKCQTNLDSITLGAGTPSNAARLLLCNFVVQLRDNYIVYYETLNCDAPSEIKISRPVFVTVSITKSRT